MPHPRPSGPAPAGWDREGLYLVAVATAVVSLWTYAAIPPASDGTYTPADPAATALLAAATAVSPAGPPSVAAAAGSGRCHRGGPHVGRKNVA